MASTLESWILHLKRSDRDSPLRVLYQKFVTVEVVPPSILKSFGRFVYDLRIVIIFVWKRLKSLLYIQPVFSCRCDSVGSGLRLISMPEISGHTRITLGNDVQLNGSFSVDSGRFYDNPSLNIGNRVFLGHDLQITCNREVVIEDDVLIAANCRISDSDGHPTALDERIKRAAPGLVRPVRICRGAWVCAGSFILKGVMVGEGSVVGANSVVTGDVPPHTIVAGSPARIIGPTPITGIPSLADKRPWSFASGRRS